jgi:male-specific lethal 1
MFQITRAGRLNEVQAKLRISDTTKQHKPRIMVSYNWDHQHIVKKIVRHLQKRDIDVWFDVDQMGGSTLEAMANAIEGSDIILLCLSDKYQASPNCRTEGEYAFTLRKTIIPLKLQADHQPRSWLGAIVGSKLYFQFDSDENHSEENESRYQDTFNALLAEIGTQLSRMQVIPSLSKSTIAANSGFELSTTSSKPTTAATATSRLDRVVSEISDPKKWCTEVGLTAVGAKLSTQGLSIAGLYTLKRWEKKDPRLFMETAEKLTLSTTEALALADHLYRLPE